MENYLYFVSLQSYFISMWRVLIQGFFWEPRGWVDVVWNILPGKLINHVVSCYHTTQRQKLEKYFQCGRHHKIMNNLMSRIMNHYQWRREGAQGERPPPDTEKCWRKMVLSSRGLDFRRRCKITEKFTEKLWQSPFFIEILMKNIKILVFSGPNAQNFACRFLTFPRLMEIIGQVLISLYFQQITVKFLQKFQEFSFIYQYSSSI